MKYNSPDYKPVKFFTGLASLVLAVKNWRISVLTLLFVMLSIRLYQIDISQMSISMIMCFYLALSLLVALGFVIGTYSYMVSKKATNSTVNHLTASQKFNQAVWEAFKNMFFLGKPLFIYWLGIFIFLLRDFLYDAGVFTDYTSYILIRNIVLGIYGFFLFPLATFMINRVALGIQVYKTYRSFVIFLLINLFSILVSYFLLALIMMVIIFLISSTLGYNNAIIAFATNLIIVPLLFALYFMYLQIIFQEVYNQKVLPFSQE